MVFRAEPSCFASWGTGHGFAAGAGVRTAVEQPGPGGSRIAREARAPPHQRHGNALSRSYVDLEAPKLSFAGLPLQKGARPAIGGRKQRNGE